jgi:hypothetical protein
VVFYLTPRLARRAGSSRRAAPPPYKGEGFCFGILCSKKGTPAVVSRGVLVVGSVGERVLALETKVGKGRASSGAGQSISAESTGASGLGCPDTHVRRGGS